MIISKNNIGDVLCSYETGKRIMITDVRDHIINFITENWSDPYNTNEKSFNGTVDYSLDARMTFLDNVNYARVMDYAEISALQKVLIGDAREKEDGEYMLITISKQREAFINKIDQQAIGRKSFLLNKFKQDFLELQPDKTINFFGNNVRKPPLEDGYIINGKHYDQFMGEKLLSDKDLDVKKAPSFNDLLTSARQRSGFQNELKSNETISKKAPERE